LSREFATLTIESAYGTIQTTPTINTQYIPLRLSEGNAVTVRRTPIVQTVRTADTRNRRAFTVTERHAVAGQIKCLAYVAHMPLLMRWALTPINAGQTSPWTTAEQPNDLASCTLDYAMEDPTSGTVTKYRYTGLKVQSGSLTFDNQTDMGMLTLNVIGRTTGSTTFSAPTDSDYPSAVYCLQDLTTIGLGGSTTNIRSLALNWTNDLAPRYDETAFLSSCRLRGRTVDLTASLLYKISPDRRTQLNDQTALTCEFVFTSGANTMTLDFYDNCRLSSVGDQTPLAEEFEQEITAQSYYDAATDDSDFGVSFT
jgi:hypothetical protein